MHVADAHVSLVMQVKFQHASYSGIFSSVIEKHSISWPEFFSYALNLAYLNSPLFNPLTLLPAFTG